MFIANKSATISIVSKMGEFLDDKTVILNSDNNWTPIKTAAGRQTVPGKAVREDCVLSVGRIWRHVGIEVNCAD